jgi:GNAT superfamily N-acetyltransferase
MASSLSVGTIIELIENTKENTPLAVTIYRRSRAGDAQAVFELTRKSVRKLSPAFYTADAVETWMTGRDAQTYHADCASGSMTIAEVDGAPAGFSHAEPGEIIRLFVDVDYTGLGIGAELMRRALGDALPRGSGLVKIDATLNAVPFYEKWGFATVGKSVFPGRGSELPEIDVVMMEQHFDRMPG